MMNLGWLRTDVHLKEMFVFFINRYRLVISSEQDSYHICGY